MQAAEYADKAAALDATVPQIHFGHRDEAAWKVEELLALSPEFSLSRLLLAFPLKDPQQREALTRAVAQLGLSE